MGGGVGQGGGGAYTESCEGGIDESPHIGGPDAAHGGDNPREEPVAGVGSARGVLADLVSGADLEGVVRAAAGGGDVGGEERSDD